MADPPPPATYALVDLAAAAPLRALVERLARAGDAHCLFEGRLDPALMCVAPYIIPLARAPELHARWRNEGVGYAWGVLFDSVLPPHLARRHMRRFLQVKLPDGSGPVLMRIWDPRVLRPILEQADAVWREALFRDVRCYWIEEGAQMVRWPAPPQGATASARPRGGMTVTPAQMEALGRRQRSALALRLEQRTGGRTRADRFEEYIMEAMRAGVMLERDASDLCLLLEQADRGGRPAAIGALLADHAVPGPLKVFQVRHALQEAGR